MTTTESRWILAIDPGLTGALAFYSAADRARVSVYDMPVIDGAINAHQLRHIIKMYHPDIAYLEQVGPMPRDGVRQAWRFSGAFHVAKTVVELLNIPLMLVTPGKWKKACNVKGGPDGKEQCRALAIKMFPDCADSFARIKDQGRAEAALLAVYGSTAEALMGLKPRENARD